MKTTVNRGKGFPLTLTAGLFPIVLQQVQDERKRGRRSGWGGNQAGGQDGAENPPAVRMGGWGMTQLPLPAVPPPVTMAETSPSARGRIDYDDQL